MGELRSLAVAAYDMPAHFLRCQVRADVRALPLRAVAVPDGLAVLQPVGPEVTEGLVQPGARLRTPVGRRPRRRVDRRQPRRLQAPVAGGLEGLDGAAGPRARVPRTSRVGRPAQGRQAQRRSGDPAHLVPLVVLLALAHRPAHDVPDAEGAAGAAGGRRRPAAGDLRHDHPDEPSGWAAAG
eukprot:CAMPEP_0179335364 /NCGR_PEP_ID=MMETSP0797-20121207/66464_1 /TAXON_ID=47934 /ORGANISM="Dinophysis acuminata, Strain DAEP01" /LENGTH=181 /DNA_ID=CAMNT_0021048767 /DNA_START=140 /DNA_END=681 /DNA_ORIENTATION=-